VENRERVASNLSGIVAACRTSPKGTTNSSATACCITASPPRALILMTVGGAVVTRTANGMPWSTSSFHRWRFRVAPRTNQWGRQCLRTRADLIAG
jgi:hypothetical protein